MKNNLFTVTALICLFGIVAGCTHAPVTPVAATPSRAVVEPPENAYFYFMAAQRERMGGKTDHAILLIRKAIALDPDSAYLQRELATIYLQNKENENARRLVEELLASLGVSCLPFSALGPKNPLSTTWRRGCLACQTYVDQLGSKTPAEVSRARALLVQCILQWMKKCKIPVTFKTYIQQMSNVSTAMESSFPGYRSSGLLGALLRRDV